MKELHVLYPKDPVLGKCPDCGEIGVLNRSRSRNFFERIIKKITPYKLFRCKGCGWRGYIFTYRLKKASFTTLAIYLAIAAITFFVIRFVIARFM